MTVIVGVNLCDRIYIAGDSRSSNVTTKQDGSEVVEVKHDNMLKVERIEDAHNTMVASAGDAKFAKHILNKLAKADFRKEGIASIRNNIYDWLLPIAEQYFENGYSAATLIFAGSDPSKNKVIDGKRIGTLMTEYNFGKDGATGQLKKPLYDGIMSKGYNVPNPTPELPVSNTMLFSVRVSQTGVTIDDTEWGQYLIYGPKGLVKEDVPSNFVGNLEYNNQAGNPEFDTGQMVTLVHVTARSKQLDSVGGCVVVIGCMHDNANICYTGDITIHNPDTGERVRNRLRIVADTFYRVDENGSQHKLIRVSDYKPEHTGGRLLI